jgi:hypothetical protein
VHLKKVEGDDFETHKYGEVDKDLSEMNIRDGPFEANVKREVKGQSEKDSI